MPFSFLNPWLWFGALAVAAPLYLHLRRKREPNLLRFSAVRFLRDQTAARRRPWSIRDVLLLLLRACAVVLITAAFAWPYTRPAGMFSIKESVVFILDNTLSRQANDGLSRDRTRLAQELRRAGTGVQIAVIELSSSPRLLVKFGEDRTVAEQKIRALKPSFGHASYLAAFREANSLLLDAEGRRKRVVLLGDSQASQWESNVSAPPFLRGLEVETPKPPAQQLPNLWLSDPSAERLFLGDASKVNLSLRLGHLGPARSAKVTVHVNSKTVLEREVNLEGEPGNVLIQTQCEAEASAWLKIEAQVQGTPDSLPADNNLFWAVPPVTEGQIALLAQSPYLRLALSPEVMRGHWIARALDPGALEQSPKQDADVLCVESSFLQAESGRDLLKRYLATGHGVFLVVNRLSPAIDGCLRELGFESQGMHEATSDEMASHFVFTGHSIFQPFQSPDLGTLQDVQISRYAQLRAASARPLIIASNGTGLLFEGSKFPGKLFVCAFGLEREQTSWAIHPSFIPFLDLILQAARSGQRMASNFQPGDTTKVVLPAGRSAREAVLSLNSREVCRVTIERGMAALHLPDEPGLYSLSFDATDRVEDVYSVNPPSLESELKFVDGAQQVAGWTLRGAPNLHNLWASVAHTVGVPAILQQRIWWWMIVGGLLALAAETALAETKGGRA